MTTFHDEPQATVTRLRARPAHVDFGAGWRSDDHPDIDWQVRWLPETGEIWAVNEHDQVHRILLGRIEDRSDVDTALAGWDKPGVARDLGWAMTRVDALPVGAEVDGDVWGTLADIEEEAGDEEEAWARITAFYLDRGCVLVRVTGTDEPEEWLLEAGLARRLGLPVP